MQPSFFNNAKCGKDLFDIRLAVMQLCMRGVIVKQVRSKNNDSPPSIEIEGPLEGFELKSMMHAEKKISFCEAWGCRVYWSGE